MMAGDIKLVFILNDDGADDCYCCVAASSGLLGSADEKKMEETLKQQLRVGTFILAEQSHSYLDYTCLKKKEPFAKTCQMMSQSSTESCVNCDCNYLRRAAQPDVACLRADASKDFMACGGQAERGPKESPYTFLFRP